MNFIKLNIRSVIIILSIFRLFAPESALSQISGLSFNSYRVSKDLRTGIDLFSEKSLTVKENFELSFDFLLRKGETEYFGYVFRLISEESNLDLIVNYNGGNPVYLTLVHGQKLVARINTDLNTLTNKWNPFSFKFNISNGSVETKIADTLLTIKYPDIKKGSRINLYFGLCNSGSFKTTDVPAMELRDILIKDGKRVIHHWPLNEISGAYAADIEGRLKSAVINPVWLKSEHHNWKEVYSTEAEGCMWCAFDTIRDEIIILNQHKITRLSVSTGMPAEVIPLNSNLNILNSRQAIYDHVSDRVILIDIDKPSVSWFDFKTLMWNGDLQAGLIESDFNHYNKYYSGSDTSIYFFGGYGHHKYKNLVRKYNFNKGTIEKQNTFGDFYNPRYLAGLGKLNDTIYLIGGFGSESGEQILTPHSYFDVMAFSIKSRSFVKKFEISPKPEDHAFSNSIIISPHDRSYYGLIFPIFSYNGYLQLIKGSLDSPGYENLGSRIPYQFLDIKSFSDLYFSKRSGKFIAVTINNDAGKSQLKVFTLGFPPDEQSGFAESTPGNKHNLLLVALSGILLIIIIISVILLIRRKKKALIKQPDKEPLPKVSKEYYAKEPSNVSYLNFFGEFQVVSFRGEDITRKFTPLLKELFLLIWLNSIKNDIGISNEKIIEVLWHDFSETSAQNNKAVNIAKLRAILSENFSCGLTYKNTGYWRIDYKNKNVVNDYYEFLKITSEKTELSKQEILRLVEFSQKGQFLANLKYSWLEDYKVSVSNEMINRLIKYLKSLSVKEDAEFVLKISDAILKFDNLNERALVDKCKALIILGRPTVAKEVYDLFAREYKALYHKEYGKSFASIAVIH